MNYLKTGKFVLGMIAGIGVDKIVGNIVKATNPETVGVFSRITTFVGGAAIGMFVGEKISKYTEELVDKAVEFVKETQEAYKKKLMEKSKA